MNNYQITALIKTRCPKLAYRFRGCYASDTFPKLKTGEFQIVNTAPYGTFGEHWVLLARLTDGLYYFDSFGQAPTGQLLKRLRSFKLSVYRLTPKGITTQKQNSTICGLYCIYVAHVLFSNQQPFYVNGNSIIQFAHEHFGRKFVNCVLFV